MLDEAKKREKIANALLGLSFAASAAQSPKDFVRTGHIESPGTALMQRWGRVRGEAERNLDHGRVGSSGRNRKLKTFEEFVSEAKKCWPGYKKKGTQKLFGKTYNRCVKEQDEYLDESSMGERSSTRIRGRVPRGKGASNVTLGRGRGSDMTRHERSTAAIAKKAGLKGTGKFSTKDLRTKPKEYTTHTNPDGYGDRGSTKQDHYINSFASVRKAAKDERIINKTKRSGHDASGWPKTKIAPSGESVRKVKDLRRQIIKSGGDTRNKVHTVDVIQRDTHVEKGDKKKRIERGKNFIAAIKDTQNQLKKAGAKKGETVMGTPSSVMPGEDKKTGEEKRSKLYKKVLGKGVSDVSKKSGIMVSKVD